MFCFTIKTKKTKLEYRKKFVFLDWRPSCSSIRFLPISLTFAPVLTKVFLSVSLGLFLLRKTRSVFNEILFLFSYKSKVSALSWNDSNPVPPTDSIAPFTSISIMSFSFKVHRLSRRYCGLQPQRRQTFLLPCRWGKIIAVHRFSYIFRFSSNV